LAAGERDDEFEEVAGSAGAGQDSVVRSGAAEDFSDGSRSAVNATAQQFPILVLAQV